jgi:hypothetical protein
LQNAKNSRRIIVSMAGCLTVAGAAFMLCTGAEAQELPCQWTQGSDYNDDIATNYGQSCTANYNGSNTTFGTHGVCLASIYNGLYCAQQFFYTSPSNNYTVTLGMGSTPLNADLSKDVSQVCVTSPSKCAAGTVWEPNGPAINIANMTNVSSPNTRNCMTSPQSGCLIIQGGGNSPGDLTLSLATPYQEIEIGTGTTGLSTSHVLLQNLTFRKPQEAAVQGTFITSGTTTQTLNSQTETFTTLTLAIMQPRVPTPIQDPLNFVAVDNVGTGYPPNQSITVTLATTGGSCTSPPTITLKTDANGSILIPTQGNMDQIQIATPAVCSSYPYGTTVFGSTYNGQSGLNSSATFYVAYVPSPMSIWINSYNQYLFQGNLPPPGNGMQMSNYMRAFQNVHSGNQFVPTSIESSITMNGVVVQNFQDWGSLDFGGTYLPYPPQYSLYQGVTPVWTMTFDQPNATLPGYFSQAGAIVCMRTDYGSAAAINGSTTGVQSTDITFQSIDWIGEGRSTFQNSNGVSILDSAIQRDTTTYPGGQLPCYGSGSGGLQINPKQLTGNTTAITYGNTIQNFSAYGTADDSIAIYNDVGGSSFYTTPPLAQSNINLSTIVSPDGHPIRLANDYTVTKIPDNSIDTQLDIGTCPAPEGPAGATGSPVCVDSSTKDQILSSSANCDTDFWDYPVISGGWGMGCPFWYSYAAFMDDKPI